VVIQENLKLAIGEMVAVLTIAPTAKVNDMDKNIIRPRLYHLATVGHKEEFEQLQANNKKQAERIKGLETENKRLRALLKKEIDDGRADADIFDAWLEQALKGKE